MTCSTELHFTLEYDSATPQHLALICSTAVPSRVIPRYRLWLEEYMLLIISEYYSQAPIALEV